MGRRERKDTGNNPDMFGHSKPRKRPKGNVSPPGVTSEVARRVSQSLGFAETSPRPQDPPLETDNNNWEDIPEEMNQFQGINNCDTPPADSSGDRYARYQRELRREEARAKRAMKWLAQEKEMIAMYLNLQSRTLNWTTQHSYLSEAIECPCSPENCRQRSVDLIDILSKYLSRSLPISIIILFL